MHKKVGNKLLFDNKKAMEFDNLMKFLLGIVFFLIILGGVYFLMKKLTG